MCYLCYQLLLSFSFCNVPGGLFQLTLSVTLEHKRTERFGVTSEDWMSGTPYSRKDKRKFVPSCVSNH